VTSDRPVLRATDSRYGFFDPQAAAVGLKLHEGYSSAEPFPHLILDNFLDEEILERCLGEFPPRSSSGASYDRPQEQGKLEFKPETLSAPLRSLFYSFNSAPFLRFLENLTGIKGLLPDPFFFGAGLHEVANGGHLDVHTDFNHHAVLNLERRINVLIYLNRDWREEYGGCFEMWDASMHACVRRVVPSFNRCVIFNTSLTSFHGHPEPVKHPAGLPRRAIALYYYTATWDDSAEARNTRFRRRPRSNDVFDFQLRAQEWMENVTPPIALRAFRGLRRRLQR
jgi:Rps23 Pro-64 3,4-dihydroxylase Tpa1-like proline 4-hydroxylase